MVQLQKDLQEIQTAGVQVVGVSPDSVEKLKKFSDASKLEYPLLADVSSRTIKEYDLHFKGGLPHPGTILVDKSGTIRAKMFLKKYQERHDNSALIEAAKQIRQNDATE